MNRPLSTSIPGDGRSEGMAASAVASNLPGAPIGAHPGAAQPNHHHHQQQQQQQQCRNEERIAPVGTVAWASPADSDTCKLPSSSTGKDPSSTSSSPPTKDTPASSKSRPAENTTDQVEVHGSEDPQTSSSPPNPRQNQVSQESSRGDQGEEAHVDIDVSDVDDNDVDDNDVDDNDELQQEGDEGVGRFQQEAPPRPFSRRTNSSGRDKHHLAMARDILDGISDDHDSNDDDDDDSIGVREGPMPAYNSLPQ